MHKPTFQLAVILIASALIYALAIVSRYSLIEWWSYPQQTIAKISQHDVLAGAAYVVAFAALFLLYALACRIARRDTSAAMWRVAIAGIIAFNTILLLLYPVDAADIFDNIMHGRMQTYYGANPFYQTAREFKGDRFSYYAAWDDYPSAYGPGWEIIAAGATKLAGDDVIENVLIFKMISVLAYVGTAALIALTLRRQAPERALYGTILYAWNPLVLYVTAGNGHNDAVMVLFVSLGFFFMARRQFTRAAIAETIGATVKFIPALLIPIIIIAALKQLRDRRARAIFLIGTLAACALIVFAAYAPYWRGGDILGFERRSDLYTTSLPTLLQLTLEPSVGKSFSEFLTTRLAIILVGAWIVRQMRKLWRRNIQPSEASASILIFYLLVACLWFQPWYSIWVIAIAAFLPDGALARAAIVLSFVATLKMPLFEFVLVPAPLLPPTDWREWRLTIGTLGAAWAFVLVPLVRRLAPRGRWLERAQGAMLRVSQMAARQGT